MPALAISLCAAGPTAFAADLKAGREKAKMCAVCHGIDGIAKVPNAPHLAGEAAIYIEEQLKNFRSGKREHHQMTIIAKMLNEDDIANLAAWYSAIRISVELPKLD